MKTSTYRSAALASTVLIGSSLATAAAPASVDIDADDIGGVVTSAKGPEAGVWVVAETTDTPTKFARIVVTDDAGRYVLPDLPKANYKVFVRGYGLMDSPRVAGKVGQKLNLTAVVAPNATAAAQVYPSAWWMSMITPPTDPEEQKNFAFNIKNCHDCHQLGDKATREIPAIHREGTTSSFEAWDKRTKIGPSGPAMNAFFKSFGEYSKALPDWSDRVAKGEAPASVPPRPAGIERNIVVSLWDWGTPKDGRSDSEASNTRDGTVNAYGPVFGVSEMTDNLNILDPKTNSVQIVKVPTEAPVLASPFNAATNASPTFGEDIWKRRADPRSVAVLGNGKVLIAARLREQRPQPSFCGPQSDNKYGKYFPLGLSSRQVAIYDPKARTFDPIDTCFSADHNMISKDNFIYFGQNGALGWIDLTAWEKTHDAEKSQGWCPAVLDTSGDGKISRGWSEPTEPASTKEDHRIGFGCYAVGINEKDGSLWCSGIGRGDRRLMRLEKGSNPPETCKAEMYEPPSPETFGSGGVEVTSDGVVWQNWRITGELSAFDRTKCKTTSDPKATGQGCPEGWTFYTNTAEKEPRLAGTRYKALESYLTHIDTHNTLGLGEAPMYGTTDTDSIEVLNPVTKQFVSLRVPYPMGFFPRSANGRIDDASKGWKGKGLWSNYSSYAGWHTEGGPGTLEKVVQFQMRPDPLAK